MPTSTWPCPAGVTSVWVECWSTGGNGSFGQFFTCGSGGGGGAYVRSKLPVVPFTVYSVGWSDFQSDNLDTTFINGSTMKAVRVGVGSGGAQAINCIGDVRRSGGDGGNAGFSAIGYGGGGGGGRNGDGGAGGSPFAGQGADTPAGDGGTGGAPGVAGLDGNPQGGGGGGAGQGNSGSVAFGRGLGGAILIYDDTLNTGFSPANPRIGSFGSVPAPPPAPPEKLKKKTFIF